MSAAEWKFEAQYGYFSHDHDPESWEFRAMTLPSLGLLGRRYQTDGESWTEEGPISESGARTQWNRFQSFLQHLNEQDPANKRYKLFYIIRHGQGVHNVKEEKVGRDEWNRHWSKLASDGVATWLDAELTLKGEQQATDIASIWSADGIPPPQSIYSSPLRRCLRTTALAFAPYIGAQTGIVPVVKEKLRERLGVHTCDQRSNRTFIANTYPSFKLEDGFDEEDRLWDSERRETLAEHVERSKELLGDIFTHDDSQVVALVAHSGTTMSLFALTGWKKVPVAAGAVYPLLVCRTRAKKDADERQGNIDG